MLILKFHFQHNCFGIMYQTTFITFTFLLYYTDGQLLPKVQQNNDKYSDRIVDGHVADIKDYPYVVSYSITLGFCGGFIVSKIHILTAAHCVKGADPSKILLIAGNSLRINSTIIPIAEVISHPVFDIRNMNNDVAVMKTVSPIEFSDTIKAIPIPPLGRVMKTGSKIAVSGWGRTQENGHLSEVLMSAEIPVVSHIKCLLVYPTVLTANMFCGGNFFFGGSSVCKGDSGGAVVQNGMAVGIVSFGRSCGKPLEPNVFTHIAASSVRRFIWNNTGL